MHSGTHSPTWLKGRVTWFISALSFIALLPMKARADEGVDFFEKKIRPIFVEHCYSCHSTESKKEKGGLKLDSSEAILRGGDSGPAVKAKEEDSLLLKSVARDADAPAMPPKGKLSDTQIADLRRWVNMGASMPKAVATKTAQLDEARKFWSFQPAVEKTAPLVSLPKWPIKKADYFILKKLDELKFTPASMADRRTLIRRVYFDLTGLPPTMKQVETFVADGRPDAYEKLIEELLKSPGFGEKWGRHWLDVVRYAEDNSTSEATCKPPRFPFRYRDWVIGAFNDDVPYDRFIRLQLAADLTPDTAPADYAALGFLGLSPVYHKEPKLSKDVVTSFVADEWDERVDVITRGFLGLTVACARCHDHKFDPISAKDYYALAGVMANTQLTERPLKPNADTIQTTLLNIRSELLDATMRLSYTKEMKDTAVKEKKDPRVFNPKIRALESKIFDLKKQEQKFENVGPMANVVRDAGTWVNGDDPTWTTVEYVPDKFLDLPIFIRGNPSRPGEVVPRRFLEVLSQGKPRTLQKGSGRQELAEAIVTDAASLTARVYVNRVWGWIYGRSLVATPSNFGVLGERPTHPELLDDLTARFIANKWSTKWLVREIVLSATYRQSSEHNEKYAATDPDDQWLWRAPRKRLELEEWRDAILQVSGQLSLVGGGTSDNLDNPRVLRRTVYGKVSRERPADIHRLFDLPDPRGHGEKRESTITPIQQLYFLNSPFVRQAAKELAKATVEGRSNEEIVKALFKSVLLREPTSEEIETSLQLVKAEKAGERPSWEMLAQTLLASNEFLFLN